MPNFHMQANQPPAPPVPWGPPPPLPIVALHRCMILGGDIDIRAQILTNAHALYALIDTAIRFDHDDDWVPDFQVIAFGSHRMGTARASVVSTNPHGGKAVFMLSNTHVNVGCAMVELLELTMDLLAKEVDRILPHAEDERNEHEFGAWFTAVPLPDDPIESIENDDVAGLPNGLPNGVH